MIELSFEGEIGDIIDGIALLQKRLDFRISEDGTRGLFHGRAHCGNVCGSAS